MRFRFTNAQLWRGLEADPTLTSFDVVDGVMTPVDSSSAIDSNIDLECAFVMPAFRDGHCHPLFAGREHVGADVTAARSLEEIGEIVRAYAGTHPEVLWLDAAAYDRSIDAQFTRQELDTIVCDRPLVLHGSDHHTLWVNTKALELCGLLESQPSLATGSIDLDDSGDPTGILREWDAMKLVLDRMPKLTMSQELDCLDWAQDHLLKFGVVEVQDAWIDPGMSEIYIAAAESGRLKIRTNLAFRAAPESWQVDFEYFASMREVIRAMNNSNLRANSMKFFVDGVLGSSTASVIEPYVSGPGKNSHGEQVWGFPELIEAATRANELGFQIHLHAIGDLAVRTALDLIEIIEPTQKAVIAHTELVANEDVARFAALNVTANFEPLWAREDGQLLSCEPQLGRDKLDSMYRMRDLIEAGAKLSFGSDWPVSNPDPIQGLATAVTRKMPSGTSWTPEQALSPREALNAYTAGTASQLGEIGHFGTLEVGQPADFVVLSANPFAITHDDLFDLKVERVYLQGEEV